MDRDLMVSFTIIGFPLAIGLALSGTTALSRKINSRECPYCSELIPKDVWRLKVPCPECYASLDTISPPPVLLVQKCCHCGAQRQCHTLWDNEPYCEQCLSAASPELLAAAESAVLADSMPTSGRATAWRMLGMMTAVIGGFGGLIALLGWIAGKPWPEAVSAFFVLFLILCPMGLLWIWVASTAAKTIRFKVMIWN